MQYDINRVEYDPSPRGWAAQCSVRDLCTGVRANLIAEGSIDHGSLPQGRSLLRNQMESHHYSVEPSNIRTCTMEVV